MAEQISASLPKLMPPPGSPPGWTSGDWSRRLDTILNKAVALWSAVTHVLLLKEAGIKVGLLSLTLYRDAPGYDSVRTKGRSMHNSSLKKQTTSKLGADKRQRV